VTGIRRGNRGPSAAADNRRALVAAAREVFGEQGFDAPLSAVAKRAGVGQGSLYRHFPDRVSLALAAFEENVAEVEELASDPSRTLDDLLRRVTEQTIESVAFVELVLAAGDDERLAQVTARLRQALGGPVREARRTGVVRPSLRMDELMLAIGMMASVVARTAPDERRRTARSCWRLLDRSLRPAPAGSV
jgi:AcrR family transcriptional regulator